MKQKLLLMVLALGMFGMSLNAQTKKEYQVGDDGFEWYEVKKVVNGQTKYGAEDRYGNMIVPTEYDLMWYRSNSNPLKTGFCPLKGKFWAWYSKSGKCIIPYSRGYTIISKWDEDEFGTYYFFNKPDGGGLCDRNGREVVFVKAAGLNAILPICMKINGKKHYFLYFKVKKNGEDYVGIADANGKIIVPAEYKDYSTAYHLAESRLTTTNNPLAGNRYETLAEAEGRPQGGQNNPVAGQQQQQNGGTTTVVVEHQQHQHTPQPVQQWQACFACGGMGTMGCDNCGGGGTKYIGDRLHRCSRCNGRGIIPCNVCYGNKGQYITVYQ